MQYIELYLVLVLHDTYYVVNSSLLNFAMLCKFFKY